MSLKGILYINSNKLQRNNNFYYSKNDQTTINEEIKDYNITAVKRNQRLLELPCIKNQSLLELQHCNNKIRNIILLELH